MDGYEQYGEALACYDRALALEPGALLAWLGKASALCSLGRLAEARACCERGFELGGDLGQPFAWRVQAAILAELGEVDAALACCKRALRLHPHDALLWGIGGQLLLQDGKIRSALRFLERSLELDPSEMSFVQHKGAALLCLAWISTERSSPNASAPIGLCCYAATSRSVRPPHQGTAMGVSSNPEATTIGRWARR
jgi:tetratricopeptide (TPR) repeat protein